MLTAASPTFLEPEAAARLSWRAASLVERACSIPNAPAASDAPRTELLTEWRQAIGAESNHLWTRRLAALGLHEDQAAALFRSEPPPGYIAAPWTREIESWFSPSDEEPLHSDLDVPFAHVLAPLAARAMEPVQAAGEGILTQEANRDLRRGLLERLAEQAGPALYVWFVGERARVKPFSTRGEGFEGDEIYRSVVDALSGAGILRLAQEYPVLLRNMITILKSGRDAATELVERYRADRADLMELAPAASGPIHGISHGLSDLHNAGRSVQVLSFRDGSRLVYKPKSIALDAGYGRLLDWISQRGGPALRHPRVLVRDGYGYVEHISPRPCQTDDELSRYFQRVGHHLAVFHLLQVTDCHVENVVAHSEHPFFIDLEATAAGVPNLTATPMGVLGRLQQRFQESVAFTHVLPTPVSREPGKVFDLSGLASREEQAWKAEESVLTHLHSDSLARSVETTSGPIHPNHPVLIDRAADSGAFRDQIIGAFSEMYQLLGDLAPELVEGDSPLQDILDCQARIVLRNTSIYLRLIRLSREPRFLRDGCRLAARMDRLARAILPETEGAPAWQVLDSELRALARLDVPWFGCAVRSRDITDSNGDIVAEAALSLSGLDRIRAKISRWRSEEKLRQEVGIIDAAFSIRDTLLGTSVPRPPEDLVCVDGPELSSEHLIERVFLHLERNRIDLGGNRSGWFMIHGITGGGAQMGPAPLNLYEGVAGVGVFLAALGSVTANPVATALAVGAMRTVSSAICNDGAAAHLALGLEGVGGIAWALAACARTNLPIDLQPAASALVSAVDLDELERDDAIDVMAGASGLILGLAELEQVFPVDGIPERIRAAANLLSASAIRDSLGASWRIPAGGRRIGFAHGAGGIGAALRRAAAFLGDESLDALAADSWEFEANLYVASERRWQLDAEKDEGLRGSGWCYGASGVGFTRLSSGLPDLDRIIDDTLNTPLEVTDRLCCGAFARVDFLHEAGQTLGRPELCSRARTMADERLAEAVERGRLALSPSSPHEYTTGLFTGTTGIAYVLLRLAHSELPSPLRFGA